MQPDAVILRDDTYRVMRYCNDELHDFRVFKVMEIAGKQFHLGAHLTFDGEEGALIVGNFHYEMSLYGYGIANKIIFFRTLR